MHVSEKISPRQRKRDFSNLLLQQGVEPRIALLPLDMSVSRARGCVDAAFALLEP